MLVEPSLKEVWCETLDDITLIWSDAGADRFEFVQAKSNEPDQLWSITLLCRRPPGKSKKSPRDSIVQKSLAHDRGKEPCCFRIVTARDFKKELASFTLDTNAPGRKTGVQLTKLAITFEKSHRVTPPPASPNGNGLAFWLERAVLEVAGVQPR